MYALDCASPDAPWPARAEFCASAAIPGPCELHDPAVPGLVLHRAGSGRQTLGGDNNSPEHLTPHPLVGADKPRALQLDVDAKHHGHLRPGQQRARRHRRRHHNCRFRGLRSTARASTPSDPGRRDQNRRDHDDRPHDRPLTVAVDSRELGTEGDQHTATMSRAVSSAHRLLTSDTEVRSVRASPGTRAHTKAGLPAPITRLSRLATSTTGDSERGIVGATGPASRALQERRHRGGEARLGSRARSLATYGFRPSRARGGCRFARRPRQRGDSSVRRAAVSAETAAAATDRKSDQAPGIPLWTRPVAGKRAQTPRPPADPVNVRLCRRSGG